MNLHTSILFPYTDENSKEFFAVLEVEFTVHRNDEVEVIDTEVSEVVGQSDEFKARNARDILQQFVPEDYKDHFLQSADYWDPYADDNLSALRDMWQEERGTDEEY